jgi:hypothetical protein
MSETLPVDGLASVPFEPLNPNAETVAAMKAARRGELVKVGKPDKLALGA